MTNSAENVSPSESLKSSNSNFSVQIQIEPKSQFEFVPRDITKPEFVDMVDFGGVAFLVETIIQTQCMQNTTYTHYVCATTHVCTCQDALFCVL